MTLANVLIPPKFLAQICQIVICAIIYQTMHENIHRGLPANITLDDDRYKTAEENVIAGLSLTMVCSGLELLILFFGINTFSDKLNLINLMFHGIGFLLYTWYLLHKWHYYIIWYLWTFFSLAPAIIEVLGGVYNFLQFKIYKNSFQ